MEPIKTKRNGVELGNAAAAAALCPGKDGKPITWETYQWYVRTGRPAGNPPPGHVQVDNDTGQRMYPLKDVRAWQKARPGRGNWGGKGAKARTAPKGKPAPAPAPPSADELAKLHGAPTADEIRENVITATTVQENVIDLGGAER